MSTSEIWISAEFRMQLRHALDAALPAECCGVLLGSRESGRLIVQRVLATLNAGAMLGGFAIPDHEIRRVRWLSATWRQPIAAVFHSHPDGSCELSKADRTALDYSEWPWVIIAPAANADDIEFRCYEAPPTVSMQIGP